MSSTDDNEKPSTTVAAVMAQRREAREAAEARRADAQERADKRHWHDGTTT